MASTEQIHKELDLIQDIIKRMAENSFKVKAWLMAILAAITVVKSDALIVGNSSDIGWLSSVLILPIFYFWYLDAFFLRTERLYRNLYKWVIKYRPDTDKYLYDLNSFVRVVDGKEEKIIAVNIIKVAFSKTLLPFYLVPFLIVLGFFLLNM